MALYGTRIAAEIGEPAAAGALGVGAVGLVGGFLVGLVVHRLRRPRGRREAEQRAAVDRPMTSGQDGNSAERRETALHTAVELITEGNRLVELEDFGGAEEKLQRARAILETLDLYEKSATVILLLGGVARERGNFRQAEQRYLRALELYEAHDRGELAATALAALGDIQADRGKISEARERWQQALARHSATGTLESEEAQLTAKRLKDTGGEPSQAAGKTGGNMATHARLAAKLLRDAASFYRSVGSQNPTLKEQMEANASVYDQIADLVEKDPMGVLDIGNEGALEQV